MSKTLDLGCGPNPKNPFNADEVYGVDRREFGAHISVADLAIESIPFEDESFDYVSEFDFISHIPRVAYVPEHRNCFVELMNEVWRVLKTGGLFLSFTPAYPCSLAFRDPTHVNVITDETFSLYFDDRHRLASKYGFVGAFEIVSQEWHIPRLHTVMRKVDPRRVWRYRIGEPGLSTHVGEWVDQHVKTTGKAGCLLYGPYVALPAATYKAKIYCEGVADNQALLQAEVACESGQKILDQITVPLATGHFVVELNWTLDSAVSDIEVRVFVNERTEMSISMMEIMSDSIDAPR